LPARGARERLPLFEAVQRLTRERTPWRRHGGLQQPFWSYSRATISLPSQGGRGLRPTRSLLDSSSTPQHLLYASPAWSGVVHLMPRRPTAAHRRFVGGGPGAAGPLGTATPHALPRHAPAPPPARRAVARNAGECAGVYCCARQGAGLRGHGRGACVGRPGEPQRLAAQTFSRCVSLLYVADIRSTQEDAHLPGCERMRARINEREAGMVHLCAASGRGRTSLQ